MTAASSGTLDHPPSWFHPGELVVVVELPADAQPQVVHRQVREGLEKRLAGSLGGVFHPVQGHGEPIVFAAPNRPRLAFLFYDLMDRQSRAVVKQVVTATHADDFASLDEVRRQGLNPVGAMPHWLALAQQGCIGGSPGSLPRPVRRTELPDGSRRWRYGYAPVERALDRRARVARLPRRSLVRVAVLDTVPDPRTVRAQAQRFRAVNGQLDDLTSVVDAAAAERGRHADHLSQLEGQHWHILRAPAHTTTAGDLTDHGLFVAGLVRTLAPRAPLELVPVLGSHGVGDLELLLRGLARVTQGKSADDPLVINLSLGLMPQAERLLPVWYGLLRPHDPGHIADPELQTDGQDGSWLIEHRDQAERSVTLLHAGLERLATYLLENNCLVVAAAGNDSLGRVEEGRPRLGPRVPARYGSVLGVAATGPDPSQGAAYSNVGDEYELGDHVASFGGDVDDDGEPRDGVIGVHTAAHFPDARTGEASPALANETGWAYWSGTSFTTAIVSGIAANYWASERERSPHAHQVLATLSTRTDLYAPTLRTAAIAVTGAWQPV